MYNLGFDELDENDIGWFWEEPDNTVLMGMSLMGMLLMGINGYVINRY
jgi:hypothetical protein